MIFKDKEVMEKLNELIELITNLKAEIEDVRFDIDHILLEFDIKTPAEIGGGYTEETEDKYEETIQGNDNR